MDYIQVKKEIRNRRRMFIFTSPIKRRTRTFHPVVMQ